MAFKLIKPNGETEVQKKDFGAIKQAETMNEIFGDNYVPIPSKDEEDVVYVRIGMKKHSNEYIIEASDMAFVVFFLNGLIRKVRK